jgi:hypothetical protein
MFRPVRSLAFFVPLLALCVSLTLGLPRADAEVKAFKIKGGGYAPYGMPLIPDTPVSHTAEGEATELGEYTGEGFFQLLDYTGPLTAEFSSAPNIVFTAANGDHLAMTYGVTANGAKEPGQVTLYPNEDGSFSAVFVAEFNPDIANCTGKFADLTGGSVIVTAESEPFFLLGTTTTPFGFSWSGSGTLTYK